MQPPRPFWSRERRSLRSITRSPDGRPGTSMATGSAVDFFIGRRVRGEMRLDSGYARAVAQEFETLVAHPVLKGLPPRFWLTDEPYLCEVFECDIRPPLRSSASFQREDFLSAAAAVAGRMEDNSGWATRRGRMPSPGRSARSTARSSTSSQATSGRLLKIGIAGALSKTRSGGRSRRAGVTER